MFSKFCLELTLDGKNITTQWKMPISLLPGNSYSESKKILNDFLKENFESINSLIDDKKFKALKVFLALNGMDCFSIDFLKNIVEKVSLENLENYCIDVWYFDLK